MLPCVCRSGSPEEEKWERSPLLYNCCHLLEKAGVYTDHPVFIKFSHYPQVLYFSLG